MKNIFITLILSVAYLTLFSQSSSFKRDSTVCYEWDDSISFWIFQSKAVFVYDAGDNLNEILSFWWQNSEWMPTQRTTYTRNASGYVINSLSQRWDSTGWVNYSQYSTEYDNDGNSIENIFQIWDGSAWINVSKGVLGRDANGNLVTVLVQTLGHHRLGQCRVKNQYSYH